jgi:very-short-patch-repair endonuclease
VDIDRFLASHDGVVSRDQARSCGLTDDAIAWRLATGRWIRRAPRTFLDIACLEVRLSDGRRALVDVAFAEVRLAVEVHGWAHHEDVDRFVDGRARKRALVADGWTVVEVTWHDLVEAPDRLVEELRRTLARLAAA